MKLTTGVDILRISRMEKSLANERFLTRFFGVSERRLYEEKGRRASFLAGNFCAKEAFSKALGTGIRGFSLREVEVLRDQLGRPYFSLSGSAAELAEAQSLTFDVSISHDGNYAVASVIAYRP